MIEQQELKAALKQRMEAIKMGMMTANLTKDMPQGSQMEEKEECLRASLCEIIVR